MRILGRVPILVDILKRGMKSQLRGIKKTGIASSLENFEEERLLIFEQIKVLEEKLFASSH